MTFAEYVGFYGLTRSEGLVLRYLADAYKALRQTVPDEAKTEELTDLIEWLGELVRQVDSSLLDEWEQLRQPAADAGVAPGWTTRPAAPSPRNERAFRVLVRNALFRRVELAALRRYADLGELDAAGRLGRRRWADGHGGRTSPSTTRSAPAPTPAGPALLIIDGAAASAGRVRQIFDDPAGDHDWGISRRGRPGRLRRGRRGRRCTSPTSASSSGPTTCGRGGATGIYERFWPVCSWVVTCAPRQGSLD